MTAKGRIVKVYPKNYKGDSGKEVLMQYNGTLNRVEWKHEGDAEWVSLFLLSEIPGLDGNHATLDNLDFASANHAGFQAALNGNGFVKAVGTTISYDNNNYALDTHNHAGVYLPVAGAGDIYTHSASEFALSGHNHTGVYEPAITKSTGYAKWTGSAWSFANETYIQGSPSALTRTSDTNVTLTLGGTPATALLQAVSLTLGWTGTLADGRIASAATWNAKQTGHANLTSLSGLTYASGSFVKMTGANTFTLDTNSYVVGTASALTKTDDTNVTLTLGGTPTTALLQATSLTLGWTGTLAYARLVNAATGMSVIGRTANSAGVYAEVSAGSDGHVLRRSGTTLGFGQLAIGAFADTIITYAKLQNVSATSRILGRITGGAGVMEELTGTQATTLLNNFTTTLKGLVPGSGGGTDNFLRADGAWAAPPGGSGNTFQTMHIAADSGYTWASADVVASGTDTLDFVAGSNITLATDSTNKAIRITASGGGGDTTNFTFVLAAGVDATTGTNKTNVLVSPRAGTITRCTIYAKTGPTGSALICDINLNGSTIWSTQGNRIQIAAGSQQGSQTSFNTTSVAQGDLLTIDLDQIGSIIAGKDITVTLTIS